MKNNEINQITLKIKYSTDEQSKTRILEYIKNIILKIKKKS